MVRAHRTGVKVQFEGTELSRLRAIEKSAIHLLNKAAFEDHELAMSLWPAMWDKQNLHRSRATNQLKILPLNRIGQMEGKSGSLVLIGYFTQGKDATIPQSNPIVVKTRSKAADDRLREEFDNAENVKTLIDNPQHFAIPIYFDREQEEYDVLWSIFVPRRDISSSAIEDPSALENADLRTPLNDGDDDKASAILDSTYERLREFHAPSASVIREERQIGAEYCWYLRDPAASWADEWRQVWGPSEIACVRDAGGDFANPFSVLEKVKPRRAFMSIGAIHGDLHPGNVVLKEEDPHLIDFGWAQCTAHTAKDFVLMECNLRFHTLRSSLHQQDIYTLSDWIKWDEKIPDRLNGYVRRRAELIQHLRNIAKDTLSGTSESIDWNWEYIVPLFMVAFGMLRFTPLLGNQQAAVRFVLSLASCVANIVKIES